MNGTLVVAARELVERRTVLAAALAAGLLPFASPWLPGVSADRAADARSLLAWGIAAQFGAGVALLAGAAAVGRDLIERRLSFDFARPLGAAAIWAGRFTGALALVIVSIALVLLPTLLVGALQPPFRPRIAWAIPAGAVLFLLPLGHALHLALRSRSRFLALDLTCGTVTLVLCGAAAKRLFDAFAPGTLLACAAPLAAAAILSLWAASAVQVAVGRTDPARGHRVLSLTLWSSLLAMALAFQVYTLWVVRAEPRDLIHANGAGSPRGDWAFVDGQAARRGDFRPAFLMDTATGRFLRLGGMPAEILAGSFSADGRRAAWLRGASPSDLRVEVRVADLEADPVERTTTIAFPDPWVELALSVDGGRLAAVHDGTLSVTEVDSGRVLVAARLPAADSARPRLRLAFVGSDRVRVYRAPWGRVEAFELDVLARTLRPVLSQGLDADLPRVGWNATHGRLLAGDTLGPTELLLLDGDSGGIVARLGEDAPAKRSFRWLADGSFVVAETGAESARLVGYTEDGVERRRVELGRQGTLILGAEVEPGVVMLAVGNRGSEFDGRARSLLVALDSGTVREIASGLLPLTWLARDELGEPTSAATTLFTTLDGLVRLEPATGKLVRVTGN